MRLYTFGNFYLSSIQQGIQAAHLVADMFVDYQTPSKPREVLYDWATNHKTMICLNGGNHSEITDKYIHLRSLAAELQLPCGGFTEDGKSLNHVCTCAGVVVPERLYELAAIRVLSPQSLPEDIRGKYSDAEILTMSFEQIYGINAFEKQLIDLLKTCSLAR